MNEIKNKKRKENKPTEKTRTRSTDPYQKSKRKFNIGFNYETKKNVEVADKSGMAIKKLELKKYFGKIEGKKGSSLSNRILTS